jgi:hypothetical protein
MSSLLPSPILILEVHKPARNLAVPVVVNIVRAIIRQAAEAVIFFHVLIFLLLLWDVTVSFFSPAFC